jgi:hypothetical protein
MHFGSYNPVQQKSNCLTLCVGGGLKSFQLPWTGASPAQLLQQLQAQLSWQATYCNIYCNSNLASEIYEGYQLKVRAHRGTNFG